MTGASARVEAIRRELSVRSLDAFFVKDERNVAYLSGYRGKDGYLVIGKRRSFFVTDQRSIDEARAHVRGFEIELVTDSLYASLRAVVIRGKIRTLGFESRAVSCEFFNQLKGALKLVRLVGIADGVEIIRQVKEKVEVAAIQRSADLTAAVLKESLRAVTPGSSEREIASAIEMRFMRRGARQAFDTIVAIGASAASPHAIPGARRVQKSCLILVDAGAEHNGYCADMTRTILKGRVSPKVRAIYDSVRRAQDRAIAAVKPGVKACDIDAAARESIEADGYGAYFGHSTGHGVGKAVHERPAIARHNQAPVEEGMVFTVEPGIYIPRLGGVRIEDMVLVTRNGCSVMTA